MDELTILRNSLSLKRKQLREKQNLQKEYRKKAAEIKKLYDRLLADKKSVQSYNKTYKAFADERFDDFKGTVFSKEYQPAVREITTAYSTFIKNIDKNLDDLNREATKFENKANNLDGPIGLLKSAINSLTTTIENWFN